MDDVPFWFPQRVSTGQEFGLFDQNVYRRRTSWWNNLLHSLHEFQNLEGCLFMIMRLLFPDLATPGYLSTSIPSICPSTLWSGLSVALSQDQDCATLIRETAEPISIKA